MVHTLDDIRMIEATPLDLAAVGDTWSLIARAAAADPHAMALSFFPRVADHASPVRWTYGEWLAEINRAAALFHRLGVRRGDVVAYVLPNLPETHMVIWGAERAGVVFAVNPLLDDRQIGELLSLAGARWVVTTSPASDPEIWSRVEQALSACDGVQGVLAIDALRHAAGQASAAPPPSVAGRPVLDFHAELARENGAPPAFPRPRAGDIASYFCTGGTTGSPKIARRSHANEVANALQLAAVAKDAFLRPGATVLTALPLFHVNAVVLSGLAVFAQGGHVLLAPPAGLRAPGLVERFWEIVEHHSVNATSGVPTMYASLLQSPRAERDISSLRHAVCGAAPMPVELFRSVERETGMRLLEGYGLTESACVASLNPTEGERRVGSIGLRLPWQAMQGMILDDDGAFLRAADVDETGAVCLSGPNVFAGYLNPDHDRGCWFDAPDAEGAMRRWFNTGDLGRGDADGFFWLTGRKKELIIRGGHNIDPKQIEEALAAHPAVALCAAVGRPDLHAGEVPVAYVQLREGQSATEVELLAHARLHISERAAVPKTIIVIDALPLTAVGKIFKPALALREVELTVRDAAAQCGASLADIVVEQDPKLGVVARYRAAGDSEAIAALGRLLGGHTFRSEYLA